jgi:hypothetical protein
MAFNVGSKPVGILTRALTGNVFVEQKLAFMNEGDKDGYNVYKHDIKNVLRARSVNPGSSVTNTSVKNNFKRDLTVLESFETFDPADYYSFWKDYQPAGAFQFEALPTEVQSALEELFLGSSAEAIENALTNGDAAFTSGLMDQLVSSSYTQLTPGTAATPTQITANTAIAYRAHSGGAGIYAHEALTSSNIFSKLEILIKNQTNEQRKRPGRKFMINNATADIIMDAQRNELNFKGVDVTEAGILRYAGYDMVINESFGDDTIMLASMTGDHKTDAIQLGTSMSSDFNNVEVQRLSNFGREWGMLLTLAIDIFVVRPEEVCIYQGGALV